MLYESPTYRLEADDQVLTLWFDFRGRPSHALTLATLNELSLVLDRIAGLPVADVILFRSGRPGAFLEEFDPSELAGFTSPLEFAALARRGQDVARRLEQLPAPTLAVIEGRCAGAGLELALACTHRVATDSIRVEFSLPDVGRGLLPAWGGTFRLPRLVGIPRALGLILEGRVIAASEARRIGLVDQVFPADRAAVGLQALVDRVRDRRSLGGRSYLTRLGRGLRSLVAVGGRPPLPDPVIQPCTPSDEARHAIAAGLLSEGEGLAMERAALSRLGTSNETRNLLGLHRHSAAAARHFPEPVNPVPPAPTRVGIVGGGDLGSALACRLARLGVEVVVQERDATAAERAGRRLADRLSELTRRGALGGQRARALALAIRPTTEWVGFDQADLVIEAADEDPGVKRNLFCELERRVRPRVILATAATTVTVEAIQAESARPGRIAGLHVPDPDSRRPVAELVGTSLTDPGTVAALGRWTREWGFTAVRVADRPGRLVEHVRMTYLSEGVHLVAEGLPTEHIDGGCRRFGMARGPLEWCDEIGLDRLAERAAQMQLARGDAFARNLLFQRLVPYGCVGMAVGEGFYRYGWRRRPSQVARMAVWNDLDEDAIAPYIFDSREAIGESIERVLLRTVNAAAGALAEEPDSDPLTVDLALAFGMGWAPARGGPLRYADALGLAAVVDRLALFAERFGPRFRPCDELVRRAEAGETFHGGSPAEPAVPAARWRLAG